MSVFEEMYPFPQFNSWREFEELKRMLAEAIERGLVEKVQVIRRRGVPRTESWFRDKEHGEIYSLIPPEPPARGSWERVDLQTLKETSHS